MRTNHLTTDDVEAALGVLERGTGTYIPGGIGGFRIALQSLPEPPAVKAVADALAELDCVGGDVPVGVDRAAAILRRAINGEG